MIETTVAVARKFLNTKLPTELVDRIMGDVYTDEFKNTLLLIKGRKYYSSIWYNPSDRLVELCGERGAIQTGVEIAYDDFDEGVPFVSQHKFIEPWMLWKTYQSFRAYVYKDSIMRGIFNKITEENIEEVWMYQSVCTAGCEICRDNFPCFNSQLHILPGVRWNTENLSHKIVKLWDGEYYSQGGGDHPPLDIAREW